MLKIPELKFFKNIFLTICLLLTVFPSFSLANVIDYYPYSYDWLRIIVISLLGFLILFLGWIVSPLGAVFIFSVLVQFFIPNKTVRIVAWIFQGLVLVFTILLEIVGILWAFSQYGEGKYISLISVIGAGSIVLLLMLGTVIAQIILVRKK